MCWVRAVARTVAWREDACAIRAVRTAVLAFRCLGGNRSSAFHCMCTGSARLHVTVDGDAVLASPLTVVVEPAHTLDALVTSPNVRISLQPDCTGASSICGAEYGAQCALPSSPSYWCSVANPADDASWWSATFHQPCHLAALLLTQHPDYMSRQLVVAAAPTRRGPMEVLFRSADATSGGLRDVIVQLATMRSAAAGNMAASSGQACVVPLPAVPVARLRVVLRGARSNYHTLSSVVFVPALSRPPPPPPPMAPLEALLSRARQDLRDRRMQRLHVSLRNVLQYVFVQAVQQKQQQQAGMSVPQLCGALVEALELYARGGVLCASTAPTHARAGASARRRRRRALQVLGPATTPPSAAAWAVFPDGGGGAAAMGGAAGRGGAGGAGAAPRGRLGRAGTAEAAAELMLPGGAIGMGPGAGAAAGAGAGAGVGAGAGAGGVGEQQPQRDGPSVLDHLRRTLPHPKYGEMVRGHPLGLYIGMLAAMGRSNSVALRADQAEADSVYPGGGYDPRQALGDRGGNRYFCSRNALPGVDVSWWAPLVKPAVVTGVEVYCGAHGSRQVEVLLSGDGGDTYETVATVAMGEGVPSVFVPFALKGSKLGPATHLKLTFRHVLTMYLYLYVLGTAAAATHTHARAYVFRLTAPNPLAACRRHRVHAESQPPLLSQAVSFRPASAAADSVLRPTAAAMAIDGDPRTAWVGEATDASYWQAQLAAAKALQRVEVVWRSRRTTPAAVQVWVRPAPCATPTPTPTPTDGNGTAAVDATAADSGGEGGGGVAGWTSSSDDEGGVADGKPGRRGVSPEDDDDKVTMAAALVTGSASLASVAQPGAQSRWRLVAQARPRACDGRTTVINIEGGACPVSTAMRLVMKPQEAEAVEGGAAEGKHGDSGDDSDEDDGVEALPDAIVQQHHAIVSVVANGTWI